MKGPTLGSVHLPGSHASWCYQLFHEFSKYHHRLWQVSGLRRPVIHLDIDIRVIVGVPLGVVLIIPYSLKIGRKSTWLSRRSHQQVSAVLVV